MSQPGHAEWTSHVPPQGQPPWGYGPPGNPGGPRIQPAGDDTTWALFAYVGTIAVGFLAPVVIYFVKRDESGFVRYHAAQVLNYAITQLCIFLLLMVPTIAIALAVDSPAVFLVWVPLVIVEVISQYVLLILGAVRSSRGEWYRLPTWTCWRMIR